MTIGEIQKEATNPNINVSTLLRNVKIIASKLEQKDVVDWLDKELNGYPAGTKVPAYRIINGTPQGFNPYYGWVPYIHTDSKSQEIISKKGTNQSVGELEDLLKTGKNIFAMKYPADVADTLRKGIKLNVDLQLAVDRSQIVGILEHIRNDILDWCIKNQEAGISDNTSEFSDKEVAEATDVKSKYQIQHIENFNGNISESNEFKSGTLVPQESFWSKFFWYVIIALIVLVVGNIISALILKSVFGI